MTVLGLNQRPNNHFAAPANRKMPRIASLTIPRIERGFQLLELLRLKAGPVVEGVSRLRSGLISGIGIRLCNL